VIAEFTLENYRSFKESHTFSLVSTKNTELSEINNFEGNRNLKFLKSAVLYGANASGKSNLFYALRFFLRFAVTSGPRKQAGDPIETEPFLLSPKMEILPSVFELICYAPSPDNGLVRYRYGLSVTTEKVEYEYLFAVNKVREVNLFIRRGQLVEYTPYFKEGARGKPSVRDNCSFLSVCAQSNGEISSLIIACFRKIAVLSGLYEQPVSLRKKLEDPAYLKKVLDFMKFADIQITGIKTDPEGQYLFGHTVYDGENATGEKYFSGRYESAGTLKLFSHAAAILTSLENGSPLFIDEFDTTLHPLIVETIIKLFNSPETNPHNAQLVVSCHAINILTNKLLRRDQIWFCEKDQYGATDLYSLAEIQEPVRKDATFNKSYLQGKYGAIPYIGG
jgi:AAA15 family ATPase/GTPase